MVDSTRGQVSSQLSYSFGEGRLRYLMRALKARAFRRLTRKASQVYVRGGDRLAAPPFVDGHYEEEIIALLAAAARAGCDSALIDIGANIGLTTFYARQHFQTTYCFEPNPRVFCVLKANLFDSLERGVTLYNFGLGAQDEESFLNVPRFNDGGAFILGEGNACTLEELASKDSFASFNPDNYDRLRIEIRKGRDVLADLFARASGGVTIKIDVEGFEPTVLAEIAAAMPADKHFAIIFENWSRSFTPQSAAALFRRPVQVLKLTTAMESRKSPAGKVLSLLMSGRRFVLETAPSNWVGTLMFTDIALNAPR